MSTSTEEDPNSLTSVKVIVSATFLGLVVVLGLVMAFVFTRDDGPVPHAEIPACERPESGDTGYSGTLSVEKWTYIGAGHLPVTPYGPAVADPVPACFEHSPAGAVTAAVYVATLGSTGKTTLVLEELAVDSENTEDFLDQVADGETVPEDPLAPVALRLNDYTGDTAEVSVILDNGLPGYASVPVDLVWEDGDWLWDTPSESLDVTTISSLTGYNKITQEAPTNG